MGALLFFDPLIVIVLQAGLIALIVLVAHGNCSNPTLATGVEACVTTAGATAFDAITDCHSPIARASVAWKKESAETHHGPGLCARV
jgi:hypothetical protein